MQTASGTAESDVAGVYMNMVTKSGGNRFTSDHNLYFMNESLQSDNIDDDLRRLLNANHVQLQTEAIGAAIGRPTRILAPRIVRLGITARF